MTRSVLPGSPARRLRRVGVGGSGAPFQIVVGDVITHVNGEFVAGADSYFRALDRTIGSARLTIRDGRTGEIADWLCDTVASPVASEPPSGEPRRRAAWVLLVGLTDDPSIGEAIQFSLNQLRGLFEAQVNRDRLHLEVIQGPECTAANIINRVRGLPAGDDDTVLVYYLGHGGYDPRVQIVSDPLAAHFFQIPGGDLRRRDLTQALQNGSGRLKILFTDTCNVPAMPHSPYAVAPAPQAPVHGLSPLERLLFMCEGFVDVSASSRDEYSWFNRHFGGWFTWNFFMLTQGGGYAGWEEFLSNLSARSNDFFKQRRAELLRNPGDNSPRIIDSIRGQTNMRPTVIKEVRRNAAGMGEDDDRAGAGAAVGPEVAA